ncbi:adenosine receptor A2b-like [Stylophora pistillata]|uniref:adenosine receptor A2b-like n=1 Tax=Stylophora pistillata TaxID=50429 RepID=UPI000C03E9B0|nr:adenosine receptor A2b-like [Stylophora pistillata]
MNFTDMNNDHTESSHSGEENERTITIINSALNVPLILMSILGNGLVVVIIMKNRSLQSPSMTFLFSLALSDLLVGLVAQPLYIANTLTTNIHSLRLATGMMAFFLCGVSLDTVTAISVDRLMALTYHLRYPSLVTPNRVRYTIMLIWLSKALTSSLYLWKMRECHFVVAFTTVMSLIISTLSYLKIYGIVRHHRLRIDAQQQAFRGNSNAENVAHMERLKRSALNMFVFYIVLILCYFPMYILSTLHGASLLNWKTKWDFVHTAVFMNSSINPILYCWRLPELRAAVVKILRKIFRVQTHQN